MYNRGDHRPDLKNHPTGSENPRRQWEFVPGGRSGPGIHEQPPTGSRPKEQDPRVVAWLGKVQESTIDPKINPNEAQPDNRQIKEELNKRKEYTQKCIQSQQKIIDDINKELDEIVYKINKRIIYNEAVKMREKIESEKRTFDRYINPREHVEGAFSDEGLEHHERIRKSLKRAIMEQKGIMERNNWHSEGPNAPELFELTEQEKELQSALESAKIKLSKYESILEAIEHFIQEIAEREYKIADVKREIAERQQKEKHPKPGQVRQGGETDSRKKSSQGKRVPIDTTKHKTIIKGDEVKYTKDSIKNQKDSFEKTHIIITELYIDIGKSLDVDNLIKRTNIRKEDIENLKEKMNKAADRLNDAIDRRKGWIKELNAFTKIIDDAEDMQEMLETLAKENSIS